MIRDEEIPVASASVFAADLSIPLFGRRAAPFRSLADVVWPGVPTRRRDHLA